jgi:tetratricopeptide (TPR) repeat protein
MHTHHYQKLLDIRKNMNYLAILGLMVSTVSFANTYDPYPCRTGIANGPINLFNSDDLYFAGRTLVRNDRVLEGIQCLNRAKTIAPGYIDVRLELMNGFSRLDDQASGFKEAVSVAQFNLNDYYQSTFNTYLEKLVRITFPVEPKIDFEYIELPVTDLGMAYKNIDGIQIINESLLKEAISLKQKGRFEEALSIIKNNVLPVNQLSATVYMYSGVIFAANNQFVTAEAMFSKATALAPNDVDVALLLMRVMNANGSHQLAYLYAKRVSNLFTNYGCFKLASNISDIFLRNGHLAQSDEIQQFLENALFNGTNEVRTCEFIIRNYL